jgi:hypothetical protein
MWTRAAGSTLFGRSSRLRSYARCATVARVRSLSFGLILLAATSVRADDGWSTFETKDGVTYEKRAVSGSKYYEYRASVAVAAPPARAADAVWSGITSAIPPTVKKRTVLSRAADEMLIYDQIHTPVVSDRDVTIKIRRSAHGDEFQIRFEAANELGPSPNNDYVRIPVVRGQWTIAPVAGGGSRLVYECYSEPGGTIPAFLVRGAQQSEIAHDVNRILGRLGGAR